VAAMVQLHGSGLALNESRFSARIDIPDEIVQNDMASSIEPTYRRSTGLVDVLDRVLDKGLVIAGDIRVSLAEVELLTIRIRLLVCSIDKAEQIGLDWWRQDPNLSMAARRLSIENDALREQVRALEERVAALALQQERPVGERRGETPRSAKQKP
jgi:gas vesicle protein GvpA/GvpJ/GvpM family